MLEPMPETRSVNSVPTLGGEVIDSYMAVKQLGRGAFGVVMAVKSRSNGQLFALKSVPLSRVKDVKHFELELSITKMLNHPNIVRLFQIYREKDQMHLVMEICAGGTLSGILAKTPCLPEDRLGPFLWQMLCGAAYLHHHRIIHRDIKPDNYLVHTQQGRQLLKLADFGLACNFKKGVPVKDILGTPSYVAPEVLAGAYNEKCDIWSLGVVSFVMCCGRHPFTLTERDTAKEVLRRIRRKTMEVHEADWESVAAEAKALVFQMLTWEPLPRPSAKQLVAENLWLRRFGDAERSFKTQDKKGPTCMGCVVS